MGDDADSAAPTHVGAAADATTSSTAWSMSEDYDHVERRSRLPMYVTGAAVVVALGLIAGAVVVMARHTDRSAAAPLSSSTSMVPAGPTILSPPPPPQALSPQAPPSAAVTGDLDLPTPMTRPACDGTGIVLLHNAVSPGQYRAEVQDALNRYPDASYLRTDRSCPSLRQADDHGNPIYAVYRVAGRSIREVCAVVAATGNGAYGKWLDTTTDPRFVVPC